MHGSTRERLEELLGAQGVAAGDRETAHHLASCSKCATELEALRDQARMLRLLKAPQDMEPSAGFYARVMQRIEERGRRSIWAAFIYSPFGNRLAYASLTLAVVLGSYVVAQESRDGHLRGDSIVQTAHYDAPVMGDQAQQRNAVLENFASH